MTFKYIRGLLTGGDRPRKSRVNVRRFTSNPIVRREMLPVSEGDNINGPSLIRAPSWLPRRMGEYYLYFAHHQGSYIRLAFADRLEGPWTVYRPGTLHLSEVPSCRDHIASPDVHVDWESRKIRMYFHGPSATSDGQKSFVASSSDGIKFEAQSEELGAFYLRMVPFQNAWIGMAKGGFMYRSKDGLSNFRCLPRPAFPLRDVEGNTPGSVRHVALEVAGTNLRVYFTRIGDAPESILRSQIDLNEPEERWIAKRPEFVLRPERPWEGANLPVHPSKAGVARGLENALRDPALWREDGHLFLLYAVAGEAGIAISEIIEQADTRV
jgi:hypothetical protein